MRRALASPFVVGLGLAVALGAAVRAVYVANFPSVIATLISGDGVAYHVGASYLADGHGYVYPFANGLEPVAHHPPAWVTVLGFVSWLGFRSVRDHQVFTSLLGLLLVVAIALLARQLFGAITGIVAAFIAAVYPGFWVVEAQVLSETLGLIVLVVLIAQLYRLRAEVTLWRVVVVSVLAGVATLVRSELFVTGAIVLAVVLVADKAISWRTRVVSGALFLVIVGAMLAPWAVYNSGRFQEPVLLSTNMGTTLLAGNCHFSGEDLGFYDPLCVVGVDRPQDADLSVLEKRAREQAITNIKANVSRLPVVIPARLGRMLAVFRPADTVDAVARWDGTRTWPVWLWVVSFLCLIPLAVVGAVVAKRRGVWLLPLVVPMAVAVGTVIVFYGEPRYHTPADASVVVLAAFGLVTLYQRFRPPHAEVSA